MEASKQTHQFKTEVQQVLNLIFGPEGLRLTIDIDIQLWGWLVMTNDSSFIDSMLFSYCASPKMSSLSTWPWPLAWRVRL